MKSCQNQNEPPRKYDPWPGGLLQGRAIGRNRTKSANVKGVPMSTKEKLMNEIERAPEPILSEVLDFVHFLKAKMLREKDEIAMISESSLAKDWLTEEEDEAWQGL